MDAYPFNFASGEFDMFTNLRIGKMLMSALLLITILIAATGCTAKNAATATPLPLPVTGNDIVEPTSTPMPVVMADPVIPPNTIITLPDGSQIILKPGARVEILSQPGIPVDSLSIVVKLLEGEIMALPNLEDEGTFTVLNSKGYEAQIQGCAMVVNNDAAADAFMMQCIGGFCKMGLDSASLSDAAANQVWKFISGKLADPMPVDFDQLLLDYPEGLPDCVAEAEFAIPVTGGGMEPTTTPTVIIPRTGGNSVSLTATAACAAQLLINPATPCAP